jgi:hypothetical protein
MSFSEEQASAALRESTRMNADPMKGRVTANEESHAVRLPRAEALAVVSASSQPVLDLVAARAAAAPTPEPTAAPEAQP